MLKLEHLNVSFGDKVVFQDTSYAAARGQLNILMGESGSGKSTLVQALLFHHPCSYEYDGVRIESLSKEEQATFIFQHLHCIYQMPLFMDDLTIRENAAFVAEVYGKMDMIEEIAGRLGIEDKLDDYPGALSGGERTRAAL